MPARERRVARRAKRRNQARTQDRRAYATEPLLERHIRDVTDGEPTRNQLDAPRTPRLARADEGNDVVREPICLYLDLGEISVAVVLHEHLQLFQFRLDRRPRPIAFGLPSGCRLARVARAGPLTLVGLHSRSSSSNQFRASNSSRSKCHKYACPPNSRAAIIDGRPGWTDFNHSISCKS